MNRRILSVLAKTALFSLLSITNAMAQQTPTIEKITEGFSKPAAAGTHTAFYNDAQLHKFVNAQQKIDNLNEDGKDSAGGVKPETNAKTMSDEMNAQMAEIIESEGLSVETYNAIAVAYNSEPSIRNRIDALMP